MLSVLAVRAPKLQHLAAPQCKSLEVLDLPGPEGATSPDLAHVNLMGAVKLPSSALHAVLAGAPALQSLNITACHQLSALLVPGVLACSPSTGTRRLTLASLCFPDNHLAVLYVSDHI
jgi:hypothetical protein